MLLFQSVAGFELFSPDVSDLWLGLSGSAVLFAAFAVGGFMLYGRKTDDARVKVVLPMLLYMAALLALVSAGGHFLTIQKYPEIGISKTRLMINGETHPLPRPNALRIERIEDQLTGAQSQILMLQVGGVKTWALPDNRYPVTKMMRLLKK